MKLTPTKLMVAGIAALFLVATCHAGTIQGSVVVDPTYNAPRNPVTAGVALQESALRVGVQFGTPRRVGGTLDLLARSERTGFEAGVGLVVDGTTTSTSFESEEGDTTVTVAPHDHGKHKGDKHQHGGKLITTHRGTTSLSVGNTDLNLIPSVFIGMSAESGLFVESRVLYTDGEVSNRVSVGVRF